ncbi:DNA-binding transcriptional regulator, MerR family [Micromonospora coriariae]|uniref:DNA-binding transcriptional regulator, MerR family n=1 Tax=Micromonospora coriariae TaxID=285665 RepID=A0A1C4ULG3_9ACTN|nr:MerR family transcriptional regulator [Micromonospora coriariae]SCE72497.1 DNA-binding transcriptional regulator, MerR family [Micromonospora coriariae]
MFSIGDFAALGRVSVRMLRHYDAIGLLTPARTDPATGYRYYQADQLRRLNRIIALKDLGLTLEKVAAILDDKVSVEQLHGMLRLRRAQMEAQLSADTARLISIEARLRMIEEEGYMSTEDVVLKQIAPVRVAELSALAASYDGEDIGPVIGPLYNEMWRRLGATGVRPSGAPIAYYEPDTGTGGDGQTVLVHAAVEVVSGTSGADDLDLRDLPGIESAATIVHRGPMNEAFRSMQILARWIDDNGYKPVGYAREVCLQFDPQNPANWVHEFQLEVTRA